MSIQASGIEALVCQDIATRQKMGIAKYGTTVQDNPASAKEWIRHAYEEALDLAIYLKRLMSAMEAEPIQHKSASRCSACGRRHEHMIGEPPQCPGCYADW